MIYFAPNLLSKMDGDTLNPVLIKSLAIFFKSYVVFMDEILKNI